MGRGRITAPGLVALAVLAGVLAGCSPAGTPPAGLSCGWPNRTDEALLNVAYPDAGATYWSMPYNLLLGDEIVIRGAYPEARYFSFVTYSLTGGAVDSVTDRDAAPDAGSDNPFATDPAAPDGTYTLRIRGDAPAGTPDDVLAAGGATGTVIYRVYVPDGADPAGGVPLPEISVRRTDGTEVPIPTCGNPVPDGGLVDLISLFGPATDVPAQHPPVFKRPVGVGGLYANPDNAYVAAVAAHQSGSVVVVSGTAPTVPDTAAGESPATVGRQLRYWSVCSNEYRKPYPVTDCLHDTQIPLDGDGRYTIVVSTPADRPANATPEHGVAWLDWGSTSQDMVLILRHMLPAPDFDQSVFAVAPGQPASPTMGVHAPVATECTRAQFEVGGATACGPG